MIPVYVSQGWFLQQVICPLDEKHCDSNMAGCWGRDDDLALVCLLALVLIVVSICLTHCNRFLDVVLKGSGLLDG